MKLAYLLALLSFGAQAQTYVPPTLDAPQYPGQVYFPSEASLNRGSNTGEYNPYQGTVYNQSSRSVAPATGNVIMTTNGSYLIVPNYTTGRTMSVIRASRGK